jgi:hypothetical protein
MAIEAASLRPIVAKEFHTNFVWAWFFCLLFYFIQYAVRSAPGVMIPELTAAFHLSALGVTDFQPAILQPRSASPSALACWAGQPGNLLWVHWSMARSVGNCFGSAVARVVRTEIFRG